MKKSKKQERIAKLKERLAKAVARWNACEKTYFALKRMQTAAEGALHAAEDQHDRIYMKLMRAQGKELDW